MELLPQECCGSRFLDWYSEQPREEPIKNFSPGDHPLPTKPKDSGYEIGSIGIHQSQCTNLTFLLAVTMYFFRPATITDGCVKRNRGTSKCACF